MLARRAAGPAAPGSKQIPAGEPNCLAGLAFVFTGELDSLSRDEATDLIKRYGGYVLHSPSYPVNLLVDESLEHLRAKPTSLSLATGLDPAS